MVRCEIGAVDLQAARDEFLGLMGWIGVVVGSEDRKAALLRVSFKGAVKEAYEELGSRRAETAGVLKCSNAEKQEGREAGGGRVGELEC
jgi:hypothetical protein